MKINGFEVLGSALCPSPFAQVTGHRLVSAGFRFDGASVFPILNLQWDDDAYSKRLAVLIRDFVRRKNELPSEDLKARYDEFTGLSDAGRYYFSSNRHIFRASKPGL
jgi:arsenite methyltransferase